MSVYAPEPVDRSASPRGAFALLLAALRIGAAHPLPFIAAGLLIVAPIRLLVLFAGSQMDPAQAPVDELILFGPAVIVLELIAVPALIAGVHGLLLDDLAASRRPDLGAALRMAWPCAASALGAVLLYVGGVLMASIALILPGIFLAVLLWFGPQAAVTEGTAAYESLERSAALVKGRWWATAGRLLLCFGAIVVAGGLINQQIHGLETAPGVALVLLGAVQCLAVTFMALYAALLFRDLRVGRPLR